MLKKLSQYDLSESDLNSFYNFTATVQSMDATLYYLSQESFENFQKYIKTETIKGEVEQRMSILRSQVHCINEVGLEHANKNDEKLETIQQAVKKQ